MKQIWQSVGQAKARVATAGRQHIATRNLHAARYAMSRVIASVGGWMNRKGAKHENKHNRE